MNFTAYSLLLTWVAILVSARNYGEVCSNHNDCNSDVNLKCNGSKLCDCIHSSGMIYNGTICVVLVGFRRGIYCAKRPTQPPYKELPCVENSTCVPFVGVSFCDCLPNFYTTATGLCKPKQYGANCKSENDCGTDTNLICNEIEKCTCNNKFSIYNETTRECVGISGAMCDKFGKPCGINMYCLKGKCICPSQFFEKPSGECELKRGYNSSCADYPNSCKQPFTCNSELRCSSCDSSSFIYKGIEGECSRFVGAKCGPANTLRFRSFDEEGCVQNAECVGNDLKTCQCKRDYTSTPQGTCLVAHNGWCLSSADPSQRCYEQEGTFCIEKRCACINGQVFYETKRKCVAQLYKQCNDTTSCGEDAVCALVPGGNIKHCVCNEGLVSVDDNCHPTVRQPCDYKPDGDSPWNRIDNRKPNRICDPLASLQCVDRLCQCKHLEYYDNDSKKCRGLIEAECDLKNIDDDGQDIYCGANTECVSRRALYNKRGVCTCKKGWKNGIDGFCQKELL